MARRLVQLQSIGVEVLEKVGAKRAEKLEQVGVKTVLDLLTYYPRRYLDRSGEKSIRDLKPGEEALILANIKRVDAKRTRNNKSMVEVVVSDGPSYLTVTFFNQPWRAKQLVPGTEVALYGRMELFRGSKRMTSPVVDLIGNRTGRIVSLYPQSEKVGLTTWEVSDWMEEALDRAGDLVDPLPAEWRDELDLVGRTWAMRQIHLPESMGAAQAARKRLAFDELLRLQVELVMRKHAVERDSIAIQHVVDVPDGLVTRFETSLPFELTGAQRRANTEIAADLAGPHPMHRLLQGDVGSGKTVVAVTAMLHAVEGGYQAALMAPTEVLAEQHYFGIRDLVSRAGLEVTDPSVLAGRRPVRVALLTNRTTAAERRELHAALRSGGIDLLIGTHALIAEAVSFHRLGVVVIDEQHRFGVEQRAALREKAGTAHDPDVLVMTATPIPRTAAMTVYGDLDSTVLDELPPGRTPIVTVWARTETDVAGAWETVRNEVSAGRQAYVVCPLVDGSEKVQARSATDTFEELSGGELHGLRLGLLHGQLPSSEKESVMGAFRSADLDVLVATTVIEVGVDVANATVMVIIDADHFGIAQLHQLRGRVGRGVHASTCFLLSEPKTPDGEERLAALVRSTDGFELAEVDLELRGEGTILGTRQKGKTDLKLASLRRDKALVGEARRVAMAIVGSDPSLAGHVELEAEIRLFVDADEAEFLFKS